LLTATKDNQTAQYTPEFHKEAL